MRVRNEAVEKKKKKMKRKKKNYKRGRAD